MASVPSSQGFDVEKGGFFLSIGSRVGRVFPRGSLPPSPLYARQGVCRRFSSHTLLSNVKPVKPTTTTNVAHFSSHGPLSNVKPTTNTSSGAPCISVRFLPLTALLNPITPGVQTSRKFVRPLATVASNGTQAGCDCRTLCRSAAGGRPRPTVGFNALLARPSRG